MRHLVGMQDYCRIVDDVVVFDGDQDSHVQHVRKMLKRCEQKGISLNHQFCRMQAQFAGFTPTPEGHSISKEIIEAPNSKQLN